jgi:hypothetical protein
MRPVLIASTMIMALGLVPAMAKPTATGITSNLRAVLAPLVDLGIGYQAPPPRLAPDLPRTAHRQTPAPRGADQLAAAS